jgi:hypothetical protein
VFDRSPAFGPGVMRPENHPEPYRICSERNHKLYNTPIINLEYSIAS